MWSASEDFVFRDVVLILDDLLRTARGDDRWLRERVIDLARLLRRGEPVHLIRKELFRGR